jgi:RNA polymerase sigma-70 factor (ECF subfamily)
MQPLNFTNQRTIPAALGGLRAIVPNAPDPRSVYAVETRERPHSLEFFPFNRDYVGRLTESDAETERHFVSYFSPLLTIKLKQRLRSNDQVEDLRQEVFLRVFRSLRHGTGLRRPECLGAYVYSICNNVVLEYLREKRKLQRWNQRVEEQRDPGAGVECELVNEEQRRQVRKLMNGMTPKDRFLICAIFLEERDKDEVCRAQGVGSDYMRVLLHRAKKRFRRLLAEAQAAGATIADTSRARKLVPPSKRVARIVEHSAPRSNETDQGETPELSGAVMVLTLRA